MTRLLREFEGGRGVVRSAVLLAGLALAATAAQAQQAEVSFSANVFPILQANCLGCHGESQQLSGLDLRTRAGLLQGGLHGPAVVPSDGQGSRLFRRVAGLEEPRMPMGGNLAPREVEILRRWIDQGASWDGASSDAPTGSEATVSGAGSTGISEAGRQWWAFQRPVRRAAPAEVDSGWRANPIDAFIAGKLQEQRLEPAPAADKRTLIRRAYLDLTGLPPTPGEVQAFVEDDSSDAFEKVVDRLLASPRYGERWGRHWLDVARYGDSGGYEHDYDYPNAWRYRDYVIRAFNDDKPYDRFIVEQLAGDELDEVSYDSLIATGFNRVGATVGYREKDNPQYRYTYLDDMLATTSRAFLALSIECARCHDHKFDPIPQADYYRMMAVFFPFVKYDHPLAPPDQVAAYEAKRAQVQTRIEPLRQRIAEIEEPYKSIAFENTLARFPQEIQAAVRTPESERTPGQRLLADQVLSIGPGNVRSLLSAEDRDEVEKLREQIEGIRKDLPEPLPVAMGIRDGDYRFAPDGPGDEVQPGKGDREVFDFEGTFLPDPGKPYVPPPAHFLPTADYRNKGPVVDPGFLGVIAEGNPPTAHGPADGRSTTGRRRALADWIASPDHPLTARVMVNRIWQHHFGRGIVGTPNNFGRAGQQPSHPELLDWLATEFVARGWSIKSMHRLIMQSRTYQMSSRFHSADNAEADPRNVYLWRYPQHRLEAEAIRDSILTVAGNLNLEMGGEPFFPPVPENVWLSSGKGKWRITKEGPDVWRRSVYSYWKRGFRYPMFEVFDQPNPNISCERRTTTTVPTQALTLMNNEFVLGQAKHFAERLGRVQGNDAAAQTSAAYRFALGREPSAEELEKNTAFLRQQRSYHDSRGAEDPGLAALTDLCDVILNLNEFVYIN